MQIQNTDKMDESRLELNRRNFITYFSAIGLGSTLLPGALTAVAQDAEKITVEMGRCRRQDRRPHLPAGDAAVHRESPEQHQGFVAHQLPEHPGDEHSQFAAAGHRLQSGPGRNEASDRAPANEKNPHAQGCPAGIRRGTGVPAGNPPFQAHRNAPDCLDAADQAVPRTTEEI